MHDLSIISLVDFTPGTEPVAELIKSKLDSEATPSAAEANQVLKSEGPDAARWRKMIEIMDPRDQPTNIPDLGRIAYIFKAIRNVLDREDGSGKRGKRLPVQIDNIVEWRILMRS